MSGKEVISWQWDVNSSLLLKFIHLTVCCLQKQGSSFRGKKGEIEEERRRGIEGFFSPAQIQRQATGGRAKVRE